MRASDQIDQLSAALAKAQGALGNVTKNKTAKAGRYSYSYANISDVLELIRKAAASNGLAYVQSSQPADRLLCMTTRIMHESGQWLEVDAYAPPGDWAPQSVGSAETYLRRYSLIRCFSVAAEDDDGKAAQSASPARKGPPYVAQKPAPASMPPRNRVDQGQAQDERQRKALWGRVQEAAKADGMIRSDGKGDWQRLAKSLRVPMPASGYDVTNADLQRLFEAREQRKAATGKGGN